jgi:hypothetical protein
MSMPRSIVIFGLLDQDRYNNQAGDAIEAAGPYTRARRDHSRRMVVIVEYSPTGSSGLFPSNLKDLFDLSSQIQ